MSKLDLIFFRELAHYSFFVSVYYICRNVPIMVIKKSRVCTTGNLCEVNCTPRWVKWCLDRGCLARIGLLVQGFLPPILKPLVKWFALHVVKKWCMDQGGLARNDSFEDFLPRRLSRLTWAGVSPHRCLKGAT